MTVLRWLPRFRRVAQALDVLAEREAWPRADIEAFQLERLNALWTHAVAHVPYYRDMRRRLGLPVRFATLAEFHATVPSLPKMVIRRTPDALLSERPEPGTWRRTGGSTGTPMRVYWETEAHRQVLLSRYRFYAAWGQNFLAREAYLWGHSNTFAPGLAGVLARLRQPIEDRLRNRLRLSTYQLGGNDLRGYLKRLAAFRPVMLYGYPRALELLAREAQSIGFRCPSLRLITLSGEPASPSIVETLETTFGAPAVVEYGAIESGVIAHEWPDRALRVWEHRLLVETVQRSDHRHELVVTVLNNRSFPLIRYEIEDMTQAPLVVPARGFAVLNDVIGRRNDFIRTPSGGVLHSMRVDAFFKYENRRIRRFRVHQRLDGSLSVDVETDGGSVDLPMLARRLSVLAEGYPVEVTVVESIRQSPGGKHRVVTSDLTTSLVKEARADIDVLPSRAAGHGWGRQTLPSTLANGLRSEADRRTP